MADRLQDGIFFFNSGRYFEAHEAWEDMWRDVDGPLRQFCQGLIHAAVGLHHLYRGNRRGAEAQIAKGLKKLESYGSEFGGVDLDRLRQDLLAALDQPQIARITPIKIAQIR